MANYLGIPDYIPQIASFHPDLNFYSNVLQTKQTTYDAANRQISQAYGTLLNSPMLRDGNIARRDKFFKDIEGEVKKISKLDLSQEQNVSTAMSVFKPIYDDKSIVNDMTKTKQLHNQIQRGESFRNCVDPDKCGGMYNPDSIKALGYWAQEFKNASDEDALNMSVRKFTPAINVQEKLYKKAKDMGFNITTVDNNGAFIVTHKNGSALTGPLYNYFVGAFKDDPAIKDMYETKAYVHRKDWIEANKINFEGNADAAESEYYNTLYDAQLRTTQGNLNRAEQAGRKLSDKEKAIANKVNNSGGLDPEDSLVKAYQVVLEDKQANEASVDHHKETMNYLGKNPKTGFTLKQSAEFFDKAVANSLFYKDAQDAAIGYSALNSEEKVDVNQFALQAQAHRNAIALEDRRDAHETERLKMKLGADYDLALKKGEVRQPTAEELKMKLVQDLTGSAAVSSDKWNEVEEFTKKKDEVTMGTSVMTKEFLSSVFNSYKQKIEASPEVERGYYKQQFQSIFGKPYKSGETPTFESLQHSPANYNSLYKKAIDAVGTDKACGMILDKEYNGLKDKANEVDKMVDLKKSFYNLESKNNAKLEQYVSTDPKMTNEARTDWHLLFNPDKSLRTFDQFKYVYEKVKPSYYFGKQTHLRDEDLHSIYDKQIKKYNTEYNQGYSASKDSQTPLIESHLKGTGIAPYAEGLAANAMQGHVDAATKNTPVFEEFTKATAPFMEGKFEAVLPGAPMNELAYKATLANPETPIIQEKLKALATEYISQMKGNLYKPMDTSRPSGNFRTQMVATNDPNMVAVTIYPNEDWAKRYAGKEYTKEEKGKALAYDKSLYQNGITIYMQKDKIKDSGFISDQEPDYYRQKITMEPHTVEVTGGGKATFSFTGGGFKVEGYEHGFINGEDVVIPIDKDIPYDVNLSTVVPVTENYLKAKADKVIAVKSAYKTAYPGPIKKANQIATQ